MKRLEKRFSFLVTEQLTRKRRNRKVQISNPCAIKHTSGSDVCFFFTKIANMRKRKINYLFTEIVVGAVVFNTKKCSKAANTFTHLHLRSPFSTC